MEGGRVAAVAEFGDGGAGKVIMARAPASTKLGLVPGTMGQNHSCAPGGISFSPGSAYVMGLPSLPCQAL